MLIKLGEPDPNHPSGGTIRTVPLSESDAKKVLPKVKEDWQQPNPIHVIYSTPPVPEKKAGEKPAEKPAEKPRSDAKPKEAPKAGGGLGPGGGGFGGGTSNSTTARERAGRPFGARILLAADSSDARPPEGKASAPAAAKAPAEVKTPESNGPAPIYIVVTSKGLTIQCADVATLDAFEHLLNLAIENISEPYKVYYLKYAQPQYVEQELNAILSGTVGESNESSAAGTSTTTTRSLATGPIKIVPDIRLNALLVIANRTDQNTIDWIIHHTLDILEPPEEVAVSPKPRMIPVEHARANDIANVLREVYADRLVLSQMQQNRANMAGAAGGFLPMLMGVGAAASGMGMGGPGGGMGMGGPGGGGGGAEAEAEATPTSRQTSTACRSEWTPAPTAWLSRQSTLCSRRSRCWSRRSTMRPPRKTRRCS